MLWTSLMIIGLVMSTFCLHLEVSGVSKSKRNTRCSTHKKYRVDCSGRNLSHIPTFPKSTKTLILAQNKIEYIQEGIFSSHNDLEDLDFSYNILAKLMPNSFKGLNNLLRLNLQYNQLGKDNQELPKVCFKHLKNLRHLNLRNNSFTIFPDISLVHSLEILNATFTNGMTFGQQLKGLRFLTDLDLSSSSCQLKKIDNNTFQGIKTLRYLDVSNNSLYSIWKGTFAHMQHLHFLDISYNTRLGFRGLGNVTNDLSNTSIEIFKFQKLVPTFSMNQILRMEDFAPLRHTKLREIYVDSNRIQLIQTGAISLLPKTIQKISIGDNQLSYGLYMFEFRQLSATIINVSNTGMSHPPGDEDFCMSDMKETDVERTLYEYKNVVGAQQVSTWSRKIRIYNAGLKINYFSTINLPENLTVLYYTASSTKFEIPKLRFSYNVLEKVDFSFNVFYSLKGPILGLYNLQEFNLSNNFCSNISNVFFTGTPNIKSLLLQNNLLGFVLPNDEKGEIFKHLEKLEIIDLSDNRIPKLPYLIFESIQSIKEIHLKRNVLENMQFKIDHMRKLTLLDISNNMIRFLDDDATANLETVAKYSTNLTVDLSENPIQCVCSNINFIRWMAATEIRFKGLTSYSCQLSNLTKISLAHPKDLEQILEKECSSYLSLILGICLALVLSVLTVTTGIVYRYRWKLRYLYFMAKLKYKKTPSIFKNDLSYDFDVFVSYADEDQLFVHNKFITHVERDGEFRVCAHKRDFLVGKDIAANITDAIHRSRKTVCIISHNFLNSYWCMFEFNMARMESIYSRNGENIVYLIFLEQIPTKTLPLILLELVQSKSYIEFPNDEYGDTVFWENLKQELST
ncbi:toll-like receptor 4 [Mytilus californianus]|uniref:toll-like receptor 4 n=1 Tax=Mytilus californianus TaxID=6549 RepID=UPI002247BB7A|nr:toll-like receptor 4 [Mytilus californianus]